MRRLNGLALVTVFAVSAAAQGPEDLFTAVRAGDAARARAIIESGVAVDTEDRYGSTALLMAASAGHLEVARALLELGADPNHRESFYGSDALGLALYRGHSEMAQLLLAGGAEDRATAIGVAMDSGDFELARVAVESGPIVASRLTELRARADSLGDNFTALIATARSRPDPPPPGYTATDLAPYAGRFEGWDSDTAVEVAAVGDHLEITVSGESPQALIVVAERRFRSPDGRIEASFSGRAGSVEAVALVTDGAPPVYMRRSVAEPLGAQAFRGRDSSQQSTREPTVHWPSFRGENASGIGDGVETLVDWDLASGRGVLWHAGLAGLGNSSPVVWGDRVFITTAVAEGAEQTIRTGLTGAGDGVEEAVSHSWQVLAFDKASGELVWRTEVGRGVPLTRRHFKATQANSTPATDGSFLVAVFPTAGIACLDLAGNILWRHDLGGLNAGAFTDPDIQWGFASSPIIHGSNAILQVDIHDGPYLAAWDLKTGELVWRVERDVAPSWSTPALIAGPAGEELVVNGSTIHAYDPKTGESLWSLAPNSELVIAAPVAGKDVVYVSAGYPPVKPIYAVPVGTRGTLQVDPRGSDDRLAWSHGIGGAYMPTPLLYRGIYYVVHHNGRLVTYDAGSGEAIYKSRFSKGGVFTGSPVAVNGRLYLPTEEGLLYVLAAGPEYEELAVHDFGEPLMATPAVSEGVLYFRTPSRLYAIGQRH